MNKEISKEKLKEIVKSLMLEPSEEVLNGILSDWKDLLVNIEILNKINTDNVEPMTHINQTPKIDFLREDQVDNSYAITKQDMLNNAVNKDADFVLTSKVVK
ncbi:Asp-tRNA(Asn)/Glu-tRNA(Gln) amidotransferase subunit GatC [Mycoplasmopsis alligatoris]|uniref:Glutamyl-tRNA(Gln) and/or aspartyl-tRNA(Asn) amidotransferase, C subunit n=1 Tax=Mycoplasmopsis alligatoris A21JP2 TaxID=747682 RepID=D4XV61_9BACT|nr:Asp-tRNA(Asn)/Glu-tRNA(Gln) amidotransferase subunit GatC [Mycoplasmopsis alligatoris]EFF41777.1 glutamyl-tRNA(Gln) and/or aspartyl-tRNA(Asn) amidotransferase, C subunit [Mycoplasmopsis alligatoris A21JP2]